VNGFTNTLGKTHLKKKSIDSKMDVSDTNPQSVKTCSRCGERGETDKFIKNRNICKVCRNKSSNEKYLAKKEQILNAPVDTTQECNICNDTKPLSCFLKTSKTCYDCNNAKRRERYNNDNEHRLKLIVTASTFKHNKAVERRRVEQEEIGIGNKECRYCFEIKPADGFRYNRRKCRTCERDEPLEKFKRNVRSRIHSALNYQGVKKTKHTIEYLGTTAAEYIQWLVDNDSGYTMENRGTVWHIDHVIPLCRFDLTNIDEQMVAFNWRNTMPFAAAENLSKNKKISPHQVERHYKHLSDYHKEKNIEMPQVFVNLFAKHLVVPESP